WSPFLAGAGRGPRLRYSDPERQSSSSDAPYPPSQCEYAMQIVRALGPGLAGYVFGPGLPPRGQRAGVRPDPRTSPLIRASETYFPPSLRRHTLFLLMSDSPYYVNQLDAATREEYRWAHAKAAEVLEAARSAAMVAGSDFGSDDFIDRAHLSEAGGRKLADLV